MGRVTDRRVKDVGDGLVGGHHLPAHHAGVRVVVLHLVVHLIRGQLRHVVLMVQHRVHEVVAGALSL